MGARVLAGSDTAPIVGINWGSSNFRAYLIAADGSLLDEVNDTAGVIGLDRDAVTTRVGDVARRWPQAGAIYASGMIGSNIGWIEVPYAEAPAGAAELAAAAVNTAIGDVAVTIIPGVACVRAFDGKPDILRGEEIELLGLALLQPGDGSAALPGTHTKWVRRESGRIVDFFTSMSGEIFDRLTAQGLLASIVDGEARDGPAFRDAVATGLAGDTSLGTSLFGARALVIRGKLTKVDAASYLRGLLIGAEIADAQRVDPALAGQPVPLVGNAALSGLYAAALATVGIVGEAVESRRACLAGFLALHRARHG